MNLYLIVFLLLGVGTLMEWFYPKHQKKVYWICWTAAAAVLCFRYGQGTDYITYHGIYETVPLLVDLPHAYFFGVYPQEIGWRVLNLLFREAHIPFQVFVLILGLAQMLLIHRFLKRHVSLRTAGLFLSYPVLYVVYMVSGLRQGFAMCLFLGIALDFYLQKKWVRYVLTVLFASLFHMVSLVWLVLVVVYYLPFVWMLAAFFGAVAAGALLQVPAVQQLIMSAVPIHHVIQFFEDGTISLMAIGERLVCCGALLFLYWKYGRKNDTDRNIQLVMKAYLCGICIYMVLMGSSYYASRFSCIFKILECVLVVDLVSERQLLQKAAAVCFFALTLLMGVKNMNAMIAEGGYDTASVHVWNFPYVSIFNPEKINRYLPYDENWQDIYYWSDMYQETWRLEDDYYLCDWKFW